ncbi:MAG: cytochrome C oxidase subunit IV family protein [Candidatus Bilamarchaeaceae archaeon]
MQEINQHVNDNSYAEDVDNPFSLYIVWLVVLVLVFLNVWLSSVGLGRNTLFFQLAISAVQISLVGYYFMHLKRRDKVVALTAIASVFWVAILFILMLSDYMSRHIIVSN